MNDSRVPGGVQRWFKVGVGLLVLVFIAILIHRAFGSPGVVGYMIGLVAMVIYLLYHALFT